MFNSVLKTNILIILYVMISDSKAKQTVYFVCLFLCLFRFCIVACSFAFAVVLAYLALYAKIGLHSELGLFQVP